ncbi:hypothetical protein [Streptomyces sp. H39-S7]|uniref:hypothetical protein n=1 Tax=Streptomyces sp. H39-S7 TaxID=3004357 RepID=UPI0022B07A88|nr:hypothetical protein [Streptomyces sp. H39-S7]MCZ4122749.1 hypothetical protein [Streptomyces sp. H39-S7]
MRDKDLYGLSVAFDIAGIDRTLTPEERLVNAVTFAQHSHDLEKEGRAACVYRAPIPRKGFIHAPDLPQHFRRSSESVQLAGVSRSTIPRQCIVHSTVSSQPFGCPEHTGAVARINSSLKKSKRLIRAIAFE